ADAVGRRRAGACAGAWAARVRADVRIGTGHAAIVAGSRCTGPAGAAAHACGYGRPGTATGAAAACTAAATGLREGHRRAGGEERGRQDGETLTSSDHAIVPSIVGRQRGARAQVASRKWKALAWLVCDVSMRTRLNMSFCIQDAVEGCIHDAGQGQ